MFRDEEVKVVLCVCGGFGIGCIVVGIDFSLICKYFKIFWGYSDIMFLYIVIY